MVMKVKWKQHVKLKTILGWMILWFQSMQYLVQHLIHENSWPHQEEGRRHNN